MSDRTTIQWLQSLRSFIYHLLDPIMKKSHLLLYFDERSMRIWAEAFTHETVSSTHNYEDLEFIGDAMLKAVFPKYLRKILPDLHKGDYTELNVAYMSKISQAELARKMGLSRYIRVIGIDRAILNLETDVFESFIGALATVSDNIQDGSGFVHCYNMIFHLFSDIQIDMTKAKGSAKTQVIQIFTRFSLPKPLECVDKSTTYNIKFWVQLDQSHIPFLRSYQVNITDDVIGYGEGSTQKEAEYIAYGQALNFLYNNSITPEWAEAKKKEKDFSEPGVKLYVPAATTRYKQEGYVDMVFFIPRKTVTPKGGVVQLLGVRPNGTKELLAYTYGTDGQNGYSDSKALIVKQYATGNKI